MSFRVCADLDLNIGDILAKSGSSKISSSLMSCKNIEMTWKIVDSTVFNFVKMQKGPMLHNGNTLFYFITIFLKFYTQIATPVEIHCNFI